MTDARALAWAIASDAFIPGAARNAFAEDITSLIATALQQARAEGFEEAMRAVCHGCEEGLRFAPLPDDPALSVHWSDGESWGCCDAGPIRARHPAGWHVQVQKEPT